MKVVPAAALSDAQEKGKYLGANHYHTHTLLYTKIGLFLYNSWDLQPLDLLEGLTLHFYQPSKEVSEINQSTYGSIYQFNYLFFLVGRFQRCSELDTR